ncbi:signal recognition particle-docking protein FtsY [Devosia sp.]|uniref:signal recognition particle-docking protein FtsY n=1 Tax=Devosia sp. TaxID=1871048 RepID=UPI003A947AB6
MAEKKKGFFSRLFGRAETPPEPTPAPPADTPEVSSTGLSDEDYLVERIDTDVPPILPPDQEIALEAAMHEAGMRITPEAETEPPPAPAPEPGETTDDEAPQAGLSDEDYVLETIDQNDPPILAPADEIALEEAMHDAGMQVTPESEAEPVPAAPEPPEPEAPQAGMSDEDYVLETIDENDPPILPPGEEIALEAAMHDAGMQVTPESEEPPAGPPEATSDYAERVDDDAAEPTEPVEDITPPEAPKKLNWFQRLASGLKRSSDQLTENIAAVFTKKKLDQAMLDDLEDILIQSDFGVDMAVTVTDALRRDRFDKDVTDEEVRAVLSREIVSVLDPVAQPLVIDPAKTPYVILMVGVNGSGKTTTIGKLASLYARDGKKVMLAAGDTFRAAAIEQLQVWGQRTGAPVVAKPAGSDASGLAYEAVERARAEGADVLIIDTAGRLQNRDELMSELEKIIRVIKKVEPSAPHATLLTLDATTGQNALNQVDIFGKRAGVTGLVMTKLDGTARGGILVAIANKHAMPVHFIGVGEGVDNLEPFAARDFAAAIAGTTS